jgi:two-component system, NtrC family, response regulator AtoC
MTDMTQVQRLAAKVARSPISILILGECGVGKDVLARSIHDGSARAARPYVAINCAAIPESLMAAELFGHDKGAFTGATTRRTGLLEAANGGTVFLDEIGDMPLSMQATLLRVIETREVRPVGVISARPIDVRFISATNKDLEDMVEREDFRRDLLHRINTMVIAVPPLRERVDEIAGLAQRFAEAAWRLTGASGVPTISEEARSWLLRQPWPGNIRELKNVMERAVALADDPALSVAQLPIHDAPKRSPPSYDGGHRTPTVALVGSSRWDRQRIVDALAVCHGNQTRAAALLGMPRRTFVSKLDQYSIPRPQKPVTDPAADATVALSGQSLG